MIRNRTIGHQGDEKNVVTNSAPLWLSQNGGQSDCTGLNIVFALSMPKGFGFYLMYAANDYSIP